MRRNYWLYGGILLISAVTIAIWLTNYSPPKERLTPPEQRPLEAYREQFRRPDGSLPSDAELRQILEAKGIPYREACPEGAKCSTAEAVTVSVIPEPDLSAANVPATRRAALRAAILATLAGQLEALHQFSPELRLERVAVDSGMKLHLYFNSQFAQVADDETRLADFSAGLHSLGVEGLRGSVIYISGEPLGVYLQRRDAERDREARAQLPKAQGDGKR
jgi:hypothetical protein